MNNRRKFQIRNRACEVFIQPSGSGRFADGWATSLIRLDRRYRRQLKHDRNRVCGGRLLYLKGMNRRRLLSLQVEVADETIVIMVTLIRRRRLLRGRCQRMRMFVVMAVMPMTMCCMRFRRNSRGTVLTPGFTRVVQV